MRRLKVSSAGKGCLNLMHVCQYNLRSSARLPASFPHQPREDRGRSSPKDPRLKCQHLSGGSRMRVEDTFIRGILRLTEAARWNLLDEIMDRTWVGVWSLGVGGGRGVCKFLPATQPLVSGTIHLD